MSFRIGEQVGAYKIIEELGRGGMATVFRAYHEKLDRFVAIKVMYAAFTADPAFLRRFEREAQVVAALEHPNIVPVYDFAEHEEHPYLVMRLVEGLTLKQRLQEGMLSKGEILRVLTRVGEGLDYAHGQGVLHRDVKPSNIILTAGGGVFITDFGLARLVESGESTMSQGMMLGTPQYVSPEQAQGALGVDRRTDVYSLGVVLFELVCGCVPFQSESMFSVVHDHIYTPLPRAGVLNPNVPAFIELILDKALAKMPADRYQTTGELVGVFVEAVAKMDGEFAGVMQPILLDFTPMGVTQQMPELPTLTSGDTPMAVAGRPISQVTPLPISVTTPAKKEGRRWLLMAGGVLLAIFLCGCLLLVLTQLDEGEDGGENAGITTPIIDSVPSSEATVEVEKMPATPTAVPTAAIPPTRPTGNRFIELPPPNAVRTVRMLENLTKANPNNLAIQIELALAYAQANQNDRAETHLLQTFASFDAPAPYVIVAEAAMVYDVYLPLAEFVLLDGLKQFSKQDEMEYLLALTFLLNSAGNDNIRQLLAQLTNAPIDRQTAQILQAYGEIEADNFGAALETTNKAIVTAPENRLALLYFFQSDIYEHMGKYELASELLTKMWEHNPPTWLKMRLENNEESQP